MAPIYLALTLFQAPGLSALPVLTHLILTAVFENDASTIISMLQIWR